MRENKMCQLSPSGSHVITLCSSFCFCFRTPHLYSWPIITFVTHSSHSSHLPSYIVLYPFSLQESFFFSSRIAPAYQCALMSRKNGTLPLSSYCLSLTHFRLHHRLRVCSVLDGTGEVWRVRVGEHWSTGGVCSVCPTVAVGIGERS